MGALMFLLIVGIIGLLAVGAGVVVPLVAGSQKRELRSSKKREAIAVRLLRKIAADDVGNPALEAQLALEEIEGTYPKELN